MNHYSKADIIQDKVSTDVKIPFSDVSIEEKKEIMSEASKAASLKEVTSTTLFPIQIHKAMKLF